MSAVQASVLSNGDLTLAEVDCTVTVQLRTVTVQSLYSPVLAQTRPSPTDSGPVRGCIMSVRVATVSPGPIQTTWIFQGQDNHAPLTVSVSAATTEGLTNTRCTATAPWDLILTG